MSSTDYKHIVRIAGKDIEGYKKIIVALRHVKGIGYNFAQILLQKLNINPYLRVGLLTDKEVNDMPYQTYGELIEILLVEDNPGDVRLTQEAFKEGKVRNNLRVVNDGIEALAFLRQEGQYANAPRPDVILLDLNLPKKDGREVLAEIKQDPNLRRIPVVVLTTSEAEQDILKTYNGDIG